MTKNEKFIKAYIEFYYGVKIKKAKIWGAIWNSNKYNLLCNYKKRTIRPLNNRL